MFLRVESSKKASGAWLFMPKNGTASRHNRNEIDLQGNAALPEQGDKRASYWLSRYSKNNHGL
jgi:hypothetical protein